MEIEEALEYVERNHRAVLSTLRRDGTPQLTPVLVTGDGAGHAVVSTTAGSAKVGNLRRDPRAWLCVLPDQFFGRWIQVAADVDVVELPDAMPLLEDYYRRISGEHEDWDAYRRAMREEHRVALLLRPTRAVASPSG
ncbi:PPOX class F420-dependent oxidoreductase [Saccharopolyspora rosea]|uniref:PPOX class F420-dependent oxidoreductase n=1 Tax=Saccharopolyspora rosea TaxID=524884 RepID=A0ABW3FV98_9PSEU|nr:PPOX class F420-dependent oxidoreductase [Saccharopolyspora rosea]